MKHTDVELRLPLELVKLCEEIAERADVTTEQAIQVIMALTAKTLISTVGVEDGRSRETDEGHSDGSETGAE